jgi:hypothetical protein
LAAILRAAIELSGCLEATMGIGGNARRYSAEIYGDANFDMTPDEAANKQACIDKPSSMQSLGLHSAQSMRLYCIQCIVEQVVLDTGE